jgi:hypothetical protein
VSGRACFRFPWPLERSADLIDFTQRAAAHAVAPQLQQLGQQNAELQQQLAREQRLRLDEQVARAVPNFQEIDRDPHWHRWLLQHDPLSGVVRLIENVTESHGESAWRSGANKSITRVGNALASGGQLFLQFGDARLQLPDHGLSAPRVRWPRRRR